MDTSDNFLSLEEKQYIVNKARSAYITGSKNINEKQLNEIELRYDIEYIADTKALISIRRDLLKFAKDQVIKFLPYWIKP